MVASRMPKNKRSKQDNITKWRRMSEALILEGILKGLHGNISYDTKVYPSKEVVQRREAGVSISSKVLHRMQELVQMWSRRDD